MNNQAYSVLTGDLVDSSKLSSPQSTKAMQWLRDAVGEFEDMYPRSIEGGLDSFRHDSWQVLISKPALSLRAAVYLRAALKLNSSNDTKYDTRISIGIGQVEMIAETRISDSRGSAFTISGKNLDSMQKARMICESQYQEDAAFALLGKAVVPLLDCLVTAWTAAEARAIHGVLQGLTQEHIAKSLLPNPRTGKSITRQAVSDSLDRGSWTTIEAVLKQLETKSKLWSLH